MAFPPQFLDEIRNRVSLASVVSRHVKLVRRGREFIGLCPFHNEKTPSFSVVEDKAFYHCFGCGAHGDVIGFSMRVGNAGFREAVEALAKEAGLEIPDELPEDRERAVRAKTLHDVCEAAALHFERALKEPGAEKARAYLARRGLDAATLARFRLGWAPNARDGLKRALGQEFEESLLVEAGLLRRAEGGDTFDFFRNRVMFPISDRQGRVIAFGGRLIEDGEPKYLNSPDTPIFEKGRTLYAVHLAKGAPRGDLVPIVAEGYMDVIALHQAGFSGAVAPLGTALTETQLLELWRLGDRPILCFDGDKAGRGAAVRALARALPLLRPENGLKFTFLPDNEDPDSLIKLRGAAEFRTFVEGAVETSDFIWTIATEERDPSFFSTPERILRLDRRIMRHIRAIENGAVQSEFQRFLIGRVWDLRRQIRRGNETDKAATASPAITSSRTAGWAASTQRRHFEFMVLAIAINHPGIARLRIDALAEITFRNPELSELWQFVLELIACNDSLTGSDLRGNLDYRLNGLAERLLRSKIIRPLSFARFAAEPKQVETGLTAILAKYHLPQIKQEMEVLVANFEAEPTELKWERILSYRDLIERIETEVEVALQWERPVTSGLTAA